MATLERLLADSEVDHDRLASSVDQLDIERARDELKSALRFADGSPAHCELIGSLRRRYETINELINRQSALRAAIDRTVVDLELLAARSVELGSRDDLWRLDESVRRLQHDVDALELAHREVEAI